MAEKKTKQTGARPQPGRPKGPLKRGRVVRLPKELDESLDLYSRMHKTPVSTIIEGLVLAWATENQAVIAKGRELFTAPPGAGGPTKRARTKQG
jgi:hypothetical protein